MEKIHKVALLVETSGAYGRGLLVGITRYCRLHRPWVFYRMPPFYLEPNEKELAISRLKSWNVDGIIVREPRNIDELVELNVPVIVSPGKLSPNLPAIVTDARRIGQLAAEHFLERAFKNFAYCGYEKMRWSRHRGEAFEKAIREAGYEVQNYSPSWNASDVAWNRDQSQMAQWLKELPKPVAVMACNDERAQQVIEACKLAGLRVPDDVAVAGVDNDEILCGLCNPPLSSIPLDARRAGYEAAELLDRLMAGEPMSGQEIVNSPTHVVTRQSTDILAVDDEQVAAALRYINENCHRSIGVEDVLSSVSISLRVLQKRFHNLVGHSVFRQIRRKRIERIIEILTETNIPITQIADEMGFSGVDHIARYFRQETNMSLKEYRAKFGLK